MSKLRSTSWVIVLVLSTMSAGLALLAILLGGLTVYALRKPHGATGGN